MTESYRLSPHQKRIWTLLQAEPALPRIAQSAVGLSGELNRERLEDALALLVDQHECLRTTFDILPGVALPVQVVQEPAFERLPDLQIAGGELIQTLEHLFQAEAHMDLDKLRVFRPTVQILQEDQRHILVLTLSILQADPTTLHTITTHLANLYQAQAAGVVEDVDIPQYIDTSEFLNDLSEMEESQAGFRFWESQSLAEVFTLHLAGRTAVSSGSRFQTLNGGRLDVAQLNALNAKISEEQGGAPLFFTVLWQTLLQRLTGKERIVLGAAFTGRVDEQLDDLLGPLTHYLPLHLEVAPNPEAAYQAAAAQLEQVFQWQECFSWSLPADADTLPADFFPVCIEYIQVPQPQTAAGLILRPLQARAQYDRFELKLNLSHDHQGLDWHLEYDAGRYGLEAVQLIADQFRQLLNAVLEQNADPADANLISESQRETLLNRFNAAKTELPAESERLAHLAFANQALKTPDTPALVFENQVWTYAQLQDEITRLSSQLRARGLKAETPVGVYMGREPRMLISVLAIFRAGGVYLPLDITYPWERLEMILEDAQPALILTTSVHGESLSQPWSQRALDLDQRIDADGPTEPAQVTPQQTAYMIFTSGSTGRPKGVAVSHQALTAHAFSAAQTFGLNEDDRMLHFAPFNFDTTFDQIMPPLVSGATVVLRGDEVWDVGELAGHITRFCLTVVNLPTAYWALFTQALQEQAGKAETLRLVIVGGEAMSPETVRQWFNSAYADVALLNAYGPTETCVTAAAYLLKSADDLHQGRTPIGLALPNRNLHVLSDKGHLCPIGVPGELCIGGRSVARGYPGKPAETALKFIPDAYSETPGARLYRTGDLAIRFMDGNLAFMGRNDHQVKIRGFRVELGEIEHALEALPELARAVVQLWIGPNRNIPGLAAWYVPATDIQPNRADIRQALGEHLPDYMLPDVVIPVEELPLTPSGKLDRNALPDPADYHEDGAAETRLRTQTQITLAAMWSGMLGLDQVGARDSFFEIGGHSLNAMQLVSRIRAAFEVDISFQDFFSTPRLVDLAALIDDRRSIPPSVPPITPADRAEITPLSFAQQRMWLAVKLDPHNPAYNMPTAIHVRGALDIEAFESVMTQLVQRHEILRTTFPVKDDQPYQHIQPAQPWTLEVLDQVSPDQLDQLIEEHARAGFDLTTGPLMRTRFLKTAPDHGVLLFCLHHIIADGWSIGLFMKEFFDLYSAHLENRRPDLEAMTVQYADYAVWQRRLLTDDIMKIRTDFWREHLAGIPAQQAMPYDGDPDAVRDNAAAMVTFTLDEALTQQLKQCCMQHDVTAFMVLFACFNTVIHVLNESDDIVLGTDLANRMRPETEPMIGFFINQAALRIDLSNDPTFETLLDRVRHVCVQAYANQDIPFDRLVEALNPPRGPFTTPFFQTKFTLQNTVTAHALELPGLQLEAIPPVVDNTKLNLQLNMLEVETVFQGRLKYKTALFKTGTVQRIVRLFEWSCRETVQDPQCTLSQLRSRLEAHERDHRKSLGKQHRARGFSKFKLPKKGS